jgi:IS6 family transposase
MPPNSTGGVGPHLKPANKSGRVDEKYIRVNCKWTYLYRAVDSAGASIGFLLSAQRDVADQAVLSKSILRANHPAPRLINVDRNPRIRPSLKLCRHKDRCSTDVDRSRVQYRNSVLE